MVFVHAETRTLTIGNPPAISVPKPFIPCYLKVAGATNLQSLKDSIVAWAACYGQKINLENLKQLQNTDLPQLTGAASDVQLKSRLEAVNVISTGLLDRVLARTPEETCRVFSDNSPYKENYITTINLYPQGCDTDKLSIEFISGGCVVVGSNTGRAFGGVDGIPFTRVFDVVFPPEDGSACPYQILYKGDVHAAANRIDTPTLINLSQLPPSELCERVLDTLVEHDPANGYGQTPICALAQGSLASISEPRLVACNIGLDPSTALEEYMSFRNLATLKFNDFTYIRSNLREDSSGYYEDQQYPRVCNFPTN